MSSSLIYDLHKPRVVVLFIVSWLSELHQDCPSFLYHYFIPAYDVIILVGTTIHETFRISLASVSE